MDLVSCSIFWPSVLLANLQPLINLPIFFSAYNDQAYKACIIQGGSPGASYVSGQAYLWKVFSYGTWQLWVPDFVALVGFFLLFTFATAAVMEWGNV
jgi:hypothetical protein